MTRTSSEERALESMRGSVAVPSGLAGRVLSFVRDSDAMLSRIPKLDVEATDAGLRRIGFGRGRSLAPTRRAKRIGEQAREELAEYFAGERGYFTIPLDLSGTPPFQHAVLSAALRIRLGEVRSYRWVARQIGKPAAVRAVGTALGTNPVPLVIPCHRVIRSDGTLGGYGGGLPLKRRLLRLESEIPSLVGNAGTRVVCRKGCERERRTPEPRRIVFASRTEARTAGYRPCEICRPD